MAVLEDLLSRTLPMASASHQPVSASATRVRDVDEPSASAAITPSPIRVERRDEGAFLLLVGALLPQV